jgi:magnesium-protoporphyrin IX monomethyl ester (oxidative) cyclase
MYRIALVNMPFAQLVAPSIALTQLKAVTEARLPGQVSVDIVYLTHDVATHMGVERYRYVSDSMPALYAGLGDWLFRRAAFPELVDNADAYLRRFYRGRGPEAAMVKDLVAATRGSLDTYLDELVTRYGLDRVDMVGFTSMFMQNVACFAMARTLKRRNPAVVTAIGGANCEFPMGEVIAEHLKDIDFVFSGPALESFPQLVECQLRGDADAGRSIPGVFSSADTATSAPRSPLGEELDIDTPVDLDYEDFLRRFEAYFPGAPFRPRLPVETSRGCWWGQRAHCTFCGLNGATMSYRAMKPELARRQIGSLFRYSGRANMIEAVDNILPKSYLQDVLPHLDTPPDMEIFYEVKADLTKREMQVLARARALLIQPGIESLATSTLKLMKKGTSALQNVTFLKNCAAIGLKPIWNLLMGFPGERADVYQRYLEVLPLLTHLPPPLGVFPVRFDRFSPYHKQADAYGLDLRPMDFYAWIYPFDDPTLQKFAYYFADHNLRAEYFKDMTEWMQPLRIAVDEWQACWRTTTSAVAGPPRLHFKEPASDVVCDSRFGSPIEYEVGALGKALLRDMANPVRVDQVTTAFSAAHGLDASDTLQMLIGRRLFFQEGDRLVSLVLGGDEDEDERQPAAHLPLVGAMLPIV